MGDVINLLFLEWRKAEKLCPFESLSPEISETRNPSASTCAIEPPKDAIGRRQSTRLLLHTLYPLIRVLCWITRTNELATGRPSG